MWFEPVRPAKHLPIALAISLALAALCGAQKPPSSSTAGVPTNHDVETLASAGFTEEFIIETIRTSRTQFDTSVDALVELSKHGINERMIRLIMNPSLANPTAAAPSPTTPPEAPIRAQTAMALPQMSEPAISGRPRIYVEQSPDSYSRWQSHAQTAEIMKTIGDSCPGMIVTNHRQQASYIVLLEREAGKFIRRDTKMVVFNRSGDMIYQVSARMLGNAVRGFCGSMRGGGWSGLKGLPSFDSPPEPLTIAQHLGSLYDSIRASL